MMDLIEQTIENGEKNGDSSKTSERMTLFGDLLAPNLDYRSKSYAKQAIERRAPSFDAGVEMFLAASERGPRVNVEGVNLKKANVVLETVDGARVAVLDCGKQGTFRLRRHAFEQLAREMHAPPGYLVTLSPVIALDCIDFGRSKLTEAPRTLRTEGGEVRAIVSQRYSDLDDRQAMDLFRAALDKAGRLEEAQIESWRTGLTSSISVSFGKLAEGSKNMGYAFHGAGHGRGDEGLGLRASVKVRNAELGNGSLRANAGIDRNWCSNGVLIEKAIGMAADWTRRHTGDWTEQAEEFAATLIEIIATADHVLKNAVPGALGDTFKPEELFARLNALKLQKNERSLVIREVVAECLGLYKFEKEHVGQQNLLAMQEAAAVMKELENAKKEEERDNVLAALDTRLEQGVNGWNLINGITAVARDTESTERAAELEALGGKLLAEYLN